MHPLINTTCINIPIQYLLNFVFIVKVNTPIHDKDSLVKILFFHFYLYNYLNMCELVNCLMKGKHNAVKLHKTPAISLKLFVK